MHAKNVTEMKKKIPSPHCDLRLHLQIKIQHQLLVCKQMFCWEGIPWSCFYLAVDVAEYFDVELLAFTNDCVFPWTPFRRSQTASIFLTWPGYFGVKTWNPTPALLRTPSIHLVLSLKIRKSIWILISIVITHASVIQRGADFVEHWKNMQYAIAFQSWNLMFAVMPKKENRKNRYYFTMQCYSLYFRVP